MREKRFCRNKLPNKIQLILNVKILIKANKNEKLDYALTTKEKQSDNFLLAHLNIP